MASGEPNALRSDKRDLPPFAALRAFDATFRLGGVRKAAESLGVDHAVVSRQLKQLETWLGVPLVVRTGNRVALTDEAARYHRRIAGAFGEIALATHEVLGAERERPLRACCMAGLAVQWLSAEIVLFEQQHPEFPVHIWPSDQPANLQLHEADVNIHFYRDGDPQSPGGRGLKVQQLVRPSLVVVASPALAKELPEFNSPADLVNMVLLHGPSEERWRAWLALHNVTVPDELPGVLCWHVHMAIAAAKLGRGVMLASRFLVAQDLARGELVELNVPGAMLTPYGAYFFVAREDRWSSPSVAAFRRFLSKRMELSCSADPPG